MTATGIVGCALIGGIGDLPLPTGEGGGPLPEGGDVTSVGPDAPEDSIDAPTDGTSQGNCEAGLKSCGTACVNAMQDPGNCGRCGHGCQGGSCAGGVCQPFALTDGGIWGTPKGILVHGNAVYWMNNGGDGTVLVVPVDGGAFASVVPFLDAGLAANLATNDTTVYFTIGGSVMSSPLAGGPVTTLASGFFSADGIAVNTTGVYFTDYANPGGVYEAPLDGGTITTLAPTQVNPASLALSDTTAYWTAPGSGTVLMVPLDGGTPMTLANSIAGDGIALDSTSVYWTTAAGVFSAPLDGGTTTTLAPSDSNASGIAVDGSGVYWVDNVAADGGTVKMLPLDGGPEVTLATSQQNPHYIAIDSTSAYWTNDYFFGNVMKVAKP